MLAASQVNITTIEYTCFSRPMINNTHREGIYVTVKNGSRKSTGEISPLPGRSIETFKMAKENISETIKRFTSNGTITPSVYPSVSFGLESALFGLSSQTPPPSAIITKLLIAKPKNKPKGPVKIKLGHLSIDQAIDLFNFCNTKEANIRIDLERKWSLEKSCKFFSLIDTSNIVYVEDPVTYYSNLEAFYQKTSIPFAIDQFLFFQPAEKIKLLCGLHSIVVKPSLVGGLEKCKKLQKIFHPIPISLSSLMETEIGISHIITLSHILCENAPIGVDTLKFFS